MLLSKKKIQNCIYYMIKYIYRKTISKYIRMFNDSDLWIYSLLLIFSLYLSGFPHSSVGKESTSNAGHPGSERSAGEGIGYPLQYSGLENSMDCSPRDHKQLNTTERLSLHFYIYQHIEIFYKEQILLTLPKVTHEDTLIA